MSIAEPTTIGLSEGAHEKLKRLQEERHFRELLDGYRFAIGLALAQGVEPPEVPKRTTIFNVGTVDPDQSLKRSIEALMGDRIRDASIYKMAERLAEWGVNELASQAEAGSIDFAGLLDQAGEREAADT
jgi:signal transduction protein with GAF and PtsI domain